MRYLRKIDEKHSIVAEIADHLLFHKDPENVKLGIIKHTNDTFISLDLEPVILFRGRDKLALPLLEFYRDLCIRDGATTHQILSIEIMIDRFKKFRDENPTTMKQPGSTLGK